jgi:hypothetical protein
MPKKDNKDTIISNSNILLYQTEDNKQRLEVILDNETVWLNQKQLAELYQVGVGTINHHIAEIYEDGEVSPEATIRKYRIVQSEASRQVTRLVDFYSLEMILSIGYRVRSHRGVQFRQWATERLHEYIIKGFTLDDERLANPGEIDYFDELLERIRFIRMSEKRFYHKIRDIYTLSADYDTRNPMTQEFFATVQNKLLYAVTHHTAAEIIYHRANANQSNMGLTTWKGVGRSKMPAKQDAEIAKNYLNIEEIETLELLVNQYLDFAELQARNRKVMYMQDWKKKLDDFLNVNEKDILSHAGQVSADMAKELADSQYNDYIEKLLEIDAEKADSELKGVIKRLAIRKKKEEL